MKLFDTGKYESVLEHLNRIVKLTKSEKSILVSRLKNVVDFVDAQGLDVQTYHCSHGFTTQDFDFQTVRGLAGM